VSSLIDTFTRLLCAALLREGRDYRFFNDDLVKDLMVEVKAARGVSGRPGVGEDDETFEM